MHDICISFLHEQSSYMLSYNAIAEQQNNDDEYKGEMTYDFV
jgi:hypothetical protein